MLPKSSQRVAKVIKIANRIAREYDQEYVGTEHLLMAIEREGTGMGSQLLADRGVHAENLRFEVDQLVKKQMEETWVFGRLPGTPHFKNVMAVAIEECQAFKAPELCTEHLLLGLVKEKGCVARKALKALGVTFEDLRRDLTDLSGTTPSAD